MSAIERRTLRLEFYGRILDHLGIQMYQSPVAAVAELVANAWDADARNVWIKLPDDVSSSAEIVIKDDGRGMTFMECQERYLKVGWNRRERMGERTPGNRLVMGRKGIGKFAGFGIASIIKVDTIAEETGERTVFILDIDRLRGDKYVESGTTDIPVTCYEEPDPNRAAHHGTTITLQRLTLNRRPSAELFAKSMARRFLIYQRADDFRIFINDNQLPESADLEGVQFSFPRDYRDGEKPEGLIAVDSDGWGTEKLKDGYEILWRVHFYEEPIDEEELRGISIFIRKKLAQTPFFFNLTGGLGGQHGESYMSGQVQADYLDEFARDITATERQRINWEDSQTQSLLEWGRHRVKQLLRIWRDRRGEENARLVTERLSVFKERLGKLPKHERQTIEKALRKVASIPTLTREQLGELGESMLLAWEHGRLRGLIEELATADEMSEAALLEILVEANVVTALHTAESVYAKLEIISGLKERIQRRELENAVRNYIADNPWLISPEWETFKKETSLTTLIRKAATVAKLDENEDWRQRVDLVLSSGDALLILEFMRPGLTVDYDHLTRFQRYVDVIRGELAANTAGRFKRAVGVLVADNLAQDTAVPRLLERLASDNMRAMDWAGLLAQAEAQWKEFLWVLQERAPEDERLKGLAGKASVEAICDKRPGGSEDG